MRLDYFLFQLGMASTISEDCQIVNHRPILVHGCNNKNLITILVPDLHLIVNLDDNSFIGAHINDDSAVITSYNSLIIVVYMHLKIFQDLLKDKQPSLR